MSQKDHKKLGERLKNARSRAGLTQESAADALTMARTTLVAIEKGERRVKPEELEAMARAYGTQVNLLTRPSVPIISVVAKFRSMPGTPSTDENEAIVIFNDLIAAELELEHLLNRPLRFSYPPERPVGNREPRQHGEDTAMEMRYRLGIGMAPITDIVSLLELEIGIRVFIHPLPSQVSGLYAYSPEWGAAILLNAKHPKSRRAGTGGHEFGHFVSDRGSPDVLVDNKESGLREERFAKAFGAGFLMPAPAVRQRYQEYYEGEQRFAPRHLILMAHAFHVSEEAMCRRLEDLQLLPKGTWQNLKERGFSGSHVRQVLGETLDDKAMMMPPRLWLLAVDAHRRQLLGEGQLAKMLKVDRVRLREIFDALDEEEGDAAEPLSS
jgi:Zn-dependent peptidase ImmA (M78 family)/DNA-binding XRE family transcriptional regulator